MQKVLTFKVAAKTSLTEYLIPSNFSILAVLTDFIEMFLQPLLCVFHYCASQS